MAEEAEEVTEEVVDHWADWEDRILKTDSADAAFALAKMNAKFVARAQMWGPKRWGLKSESYAPAFAHSAFSAMLIGCCDVAPWSAPLCRRLGPDVRRVVEAYLEPRIERRAVKVLIVAAEAFVERTLSAATDLAVARYSRCVWPRDVEDALKNAIH